MRPRPILILTALHFEARPICRALGLRFISKGTGTNGIPGGSGIRLRTVGPGATRLPDGRSIDPETCVVMAGLAGGLADDLERGDVVLDEQGDPVPGLAARRGAIVTVPRLAASPLDKSRLRGATGALAVDMENAVARDWARERGLTFVGLRVISDTAAEPLDPATLRMINTEGRLSVGRLLVELGRRPALIVTLWRLRKTKTVLRTLSNAVNLACVAYQTDVEQAKPAPAACHAGPKS